MSSFQADPIRGAAQRCEVAALRGLACVLRWLGPVRASDLGGCVARAVGPRLPASRVAEANLARALPGLGVAERAEVVRAVWDNLGRNAAELVHLAGLGRTAAGPGWELEGEAHVERLRAAGTQAVFFSGHFGNWEMVLPIAARLGMPVAGFYRAASNAAVDGFVQGLRQGALGPGVSMFAKGRAGARAALAHLRGGGSLGLMVDQKMNDGIAVPFLGRDAMTATGMAEMALRFDAAVVPVRVDRLGPARFRLVCEAPLAVERTGVRGADVYALTLAMNGVLERWVRADPGAWLWLHRRWPKEG